MMEAERVRYVPKIRLDDCVGIFVLESEHSTSSVLDEHNLLCAKQLLGNDYAAESVLR